MGLSRVSPTHRWRREWPLTDGDKEYRSWWEIRWVLVQYFLSEEGGWRLSREMNTNGVYEFLEKQVPMHIPEQVLYLVLPRGWVPSWLFEIDWKDDAPE